MLADIGVVLKHIVADQLVRFLKWDRPTPEDIKISELTVLNNAFQDAYSVDVETLRGLMIKATADARHRDRCKNNNISTNKKRKTE